MTLFVKVIKQLIERVLTKSLENSAADDKFSWGLGRNLEVSTEQRKRTRELQKKIEAFEKKGTDEKSLKAIKEIISNEDIEVESYRRAKNYGRGNLNATLTELNSSLERLYKTLQKQEIAFINTEDNNNPFNILCAHALYYLAEHIVYPPGKDLYTKTANFFSSFISPITETEIRVKKENCLLENLLKCKKKIDGLAKDGEDYKNLCLIHVSDTIEAILRENAKICEESKPISTVPVQVTTLTVVSIKTSSMKPSRGRLKAAMENAQEEIAVQKPELRATRTF